MQRKVSSKVQRIHCQLTGPAIAGRVLNHVPLAALISRQAYAYIVLRTICRDLRNINARAAINVWQYTSIKLLRQNSNTMHEGVTMQHFVSNLTLILVLSLGMKLEEKTSRRLKLTH